MNEKFFMLTESLWEKVNAAQLTSKEYKVWLYLSLKDPFGDRWCDLPGTKELIKILKISKATFYRAIAKLTEFGIIESEDKGFRFKNKLISKIRQQSQERDTSLKNETTISEMRNDSQNCENQTPEPLSELDSNSPQTIHTLQTSSYVSDSETHTQTQILQNEEEKNSQEVINESFLAEEKINDEIANSINQQEEEFFRSCSASEVKKIQEYVKIYKEEDKLESHPSKGFNHRSSYKDKRRANKLSRTQLINWQWLPEGAWNINGKLDPAFQEWLAKRWLAKYDDIADIYEAKANVLAYFHNDPEKLPIRWEQYQGQFIAKGQNLKTRVEHGCKIKEQEKQEFCDRLSALKPLDDRQSVSANNPIQANNIVLNQYESIQNSEFKIQNEIFPIQNQSDADVKIVIEEKDVIVATQESSTNIDSNHSSIFDSQQKDKPLKREKLTYYTCSETGEKILNVNNNEYKDYTGCHQKEQIPVNKNAINAIANWLKAKKGGRK